MAQWKRNLYALWVALFIAAICWTMVMPFIPLYLRELGVPDAAEFWSGIISAASAACSMVMALVWGAVSDRFGRRLMILRAGVFLTLGYILMALVTGPYGLLGVRMMIGLLSGFVPMAIALVGVSAPRAEVGWALGLVQTAWPSGAIIGPVLGGALLDLVGIRVSFFASATMIAAATVLVLFTVKEELTPPPPGPSHLLRDVQAAASHRLLMAVVLVTALSQGAILALEPVMVPFVQRLAGADAPGWLSGLVYSLPGMAFIFMAPWWARRGERVGFAATVATGMAGSGLLYLLQGFAGSVVQLGALRLLSGMTGAAIGPGVAAMLATAVPRDLRGRAFGLNQAAGSAGAILGPLLGGYIGSFMDPRGVFVLAGLAYLGGFVWVRRAVAPRLREQE